MIFFFDTVTSDAILKIANNLDTAKPSQQPDIPT